MVFVGIDWAEGHHHDVFVGDGEGRRLTSLRIGRGVEGVAALHAAIAAHVEDPEDVVVGFETDGGLLVRSLVDAGYQV